MLLSPRGCSLSSACEGDLFVHPEWAKRKRLPQPTIWCLYKTLFYSATNSLESSAIRQSGDKKIQLRSLVPHCLAEPIVFVAAAAAVAATSLTSKQSLVRRKSFSPFVRARKVTNCSSTARGAAVPSRYTIHLTHLIGQSHSVSQCAQNVKNATSYCLHFQSEHLAPRISYLFPLEYELTSLLA